MKTQEVLDELRSMGNETNRKILSRHGAPVNHFGVKVEDLKKIQKRIKKDHDLSLELFRTGNADAQYLAGLIADEKKISKNDLRQWAEEASWFQLSEYTVSWLAADSPHGWELGLEWIDHPKDHVRSSGWSTLSSVVGTWPDEALDIPTLKSLLHRVEKEIHAAGNRVRYVMNGFVISVGGYIKELSEEAIRVSKAIGRVEVDMGGTACKVPSAPEYIQKMMERGVKKKKMARC